MDTTDIFIGKAIYHLLLALALAGLGVIVASNVAGLFGYDFQIKMKGRVYVGLYCVITAYSCHLIWAIPYYFEQRKIQFAQEKFYPEIDKIESELIEVAAQLAGRNAEIGQSLEWPIMISSAVRAFIDGATFGFSRAQSADLRFGQQGFSIRLSGSNGIFVESDKFENEVKRYAKDSAYLQVRLSHLKSKLETQLAGYMEAVGTYRWPANPFFLSSLSAALYILSAASICSMSIAYNGKLIAVTKNSKEKGA